jgi:hypothetical protein
MCLSIACMSEWTNDGEETDTETFDENYSSNIETILVINALEFAMYMWI